MKVDLTFPLTSELMRKFIKMSLDGNFDKFGHFGTHFDVMNKEFPLEYCERDGVIFDVSHIHDRDIEASDINLDFVQRNSFVLVRTGMIDRSEYASQEYFKEHPQLSHVLLRQLIEKRVSMIGIDMAGVRRGNEHAIADQLCADNGVFIIENLVNLSKVIQEANTGKTFIVHTYPMNLKGYTGLPSRVVAEFRD